MELQEKARRFPTTPGVYLFKDEAGATLYVGKAKDLRARLRTYFPAGNWENAKTGTLLREACDLEAIVVDTEAEALALENTLIKKLQPRFNILLRDDKTYPFLRLSHEPFPRLYVTRRLEQDGSEYFGPYFPAGFAHRLAHFVHKHFLVPSCRVDLTRRHERPCLEYHIHRCLGPCVSGLTTPERYEQAVRDTRLFLAGRHADLAHGLAERRDRAAEAERFEEAAGYRDLLSVLEDQQQRQKMHAVSGDDADIAGFYHAGTQAALNLFHLRHGRVVDRREFFWEDLPAPPAGEPDGERDAELVGALFKQIYLEQPYTPPLIVAPFAFEDQELLAEELARQRGAAVTITVPQRGAKRAMLQLATRNARQSFQRRFREGGAGEWEASAGELAAALGLSAPPERIECFDISHFQGAETVAAMVAWERGAMRKGEYRKYKIREVAGVDDFRSLAEAVRRRYRRVVEGEPSAPSLVLIDGGIGQLHAAQGALEELGLTGQAVAALAKREELLYTPGRAEAVRLAAGSPGLRLVQQIRDEAHRFAITFHRLRRDKRALQTPLLEAPGIGPATARRLLRHFGSLRAVEAAPADELAKLMPARRAAALREFLLARHGGEQLN